MRKIKKKIVCWVVLLQNYSQMQTRRRKYRNVRQNNKDKMAYNCVHCLIQQSLNIGIIIQTED